jgi:hypothetical protein
MPLSAPLSSVCVREYSSLWETGTSTSGSGLEGSWSHSMLGSPTLNKGRGWPKKAVTGMRKSDGYGPKPITQPSRYVYTYKLQKLFIHHFVNETLNWRPRYKRENLTADKPELQLTPLFRTKYSLWKWQSVPWPTSYAQRFLHPCPCTTLHAWNLPNKHQQNSSCPLFKSLTGHETSPPGWTQRESQAVCGPDEIDE